MANNQSSKNIIITAILGISGIIAAVYYYKQYYIFLLALTNSKILAVVFIILTIIIGIAVFYFVRYFAINLKISRKNISIEPLSNNEKIETLTPNDGIAHITYFWENRHQASSEIVHTLSNCTKFSNVFISAIGLGTVKEALSSYAVVEKLAGCITDNNSNFKIQIIFPADSSAEFRPEMKNLQENIKSGHTIIEDFIKQLKTKITANIRLENHIILSNYNSNHLNEHFKHKVIPRHFILQIGEIIYVGPYLAQKEGRNSFLMKLEKPVLDINKEGMYSIYLKEIEYLKEHSIISDKIKI